MRKHAGADAEATVMLNVRVPTSLWMAIEQRVAEERRARPGEHVQRSDIVRMILARALLGQRSPHTEPSPEEPAPMAAENHLRWASPLPPDFEARRRDAPDVGLRHQKPKASEPLHDSSEDETPASQAVDALGELTVENLRVVVMTPGEAPPDAGKVLSVRASAILNRLFTLVFDDSDDQQTMFDFLDTMPEMVRDVLRTFDGEGGLRQHGPNRLTTLGNLVSFWSRRAILKRTLDRHKWSLNTSAQVLGISGGTSTVLRLLADLNLEPQLEQARAAGLVKQGRKNRPVT